jgi:chaperonin GroES
MAVATCTHCYSDSHYSKDCPNRAAAEPAADAKPKVDPYDFTTWPAYQEVLSKRATHVANAGFEEYVEPLEDQIVIRRFPDEQITTGGIALPGSGEKQHRGVVVHVGPGKTLPDHTLQATTVQVGDVVIFGHFAGINAIRMNGEGLIVLRENEITGVYRRRSVS